MTQIKKAFSVGNKPIQIVTPEDFGAVGDGVTDDSTAFQEALNNNNSIWLTPGSTYIIGDISVSSGFKIYSVGGTSYSASLATTETVLKLKAGASAMFTGTGRIDEGVMEGFVMDGDNQTADAFNLDAQRWKCKDVRIKNFVGFAWGDATDYWNQIELRGCGAYNCTQGIRNFIDCQIIGGYYNANTGKGVTLQSGANDNTFTNVKIEFNGDEGIELSASINNQFSSCNVDRNGRSGMRVASGAQAIVNGGVFRRNGSAILGDDECSNFYIEGNTSEIIVDGVKHRTGADDGGGGDTTPNYAFSFANQSPAIVLISHNDMEDVVTQSINEGVTPTKFSVLASPGSNDRVNFGYTRVLEGRRYIFRERYSSISPTTTSAATTFEQPSVPTNNVDIRRFRVWYRTTGAVVETAILQYALERSAGNATIVFKTIESESTAGKIGEDGSGSTIELILTNIATDGSTFDLAIKNNAAATTLTVEAELFV